MTALLITGGLVAIEDGQKSAEEFAPARKVRIELKFDIAEGSNPDEVLDIVVDMANDRVNAQLGRGAAVTRVTTAPDTAGNVEPAKRTRRTKAEIEADKAAAENPTTAGPTGQPAPEPATSPPVEDDWSTPVPPAATAKEVTDAELSAATTKKNGELNSPPLIRGLIATFNPDPTRAFTLAEIPQARRGEYLEKLAALKAG